MRGEGLQLSYVEKIDTAVEERAVAVDSQTNDDLICIMQQSANAVKAYSPDSFPRLFCRNVHP